MENDGRRFFRVISNQVRFGCGFRTVEGRKQYFAWFTTTEISEREFLQIGSEYPREIQADRETAEIFREKYIEGHKVLLEGWNKLL